MGELIRERSAGTIVSDSFRIYFANFGPVLLVFALPILPFIVLRLALGYEAAPETLIALQLFEGVLSIFTIGALTVAVSDICLGNRPSIRRAYAGIGRVFWSYLGTYLLALLAFVVGLVLLVVPGLFAAVALMFSLQVCILERRRPLAACKRSAALGKGYYLRNFGIFLLATLVVVVGIFVISVGVLLFLALALDVPVGAEPPHPIEVLVGDLISMAATPLMLIPPILLYYDLRARKEQFDGAALAQELMT